MRNPYIPLEVENPTMHQERQRNLTGEGREERKQVCEKFGEAWGKIWNDEAVTGDDEEKFLLGYEAICGDISRERDRIGGDWAVAGCIPMKEHRDILR